MVRWFSMAAGVVFPCMAEVRSTHASAELLQSSKGYQAGSPVEVALRLSIDEGWHTYWVNPGEAGMPLSVEWTLPDGWVAGPLLHPAPERFTTGGLSGFGYSGEVVIPVFLTAAPEASGEVGIRAEVRWLTCSDASCVAGEAVLEASWVEGVVGPGKDADEIASALEMVPRPLKGAALHVEPLAERLRLELTLPGGLDPTGSRVFPVTAEVIDAAESIEFRADQGKWRAEVETGDYVSEPVEELELVITGGGIDKPLLVGWTAAQE